MPDSVAVPDVERSGATERVVAGVGVGRRSRSLDKRSGPVVEPFKSLVATKERLAFDVQLKQAVLEHRNAETSHYLPLEVISQPHQAVRP